MVFITAVEKELIGSGFVIWEEIAVLDTALRTSW